MRGVTLVLCLLLCSLCVGSTATAQGGLDQRVSELSQQIATKMTAKQKTTIAVVEFADLQGNVTDFGRFLAEELVTRLGDLEKFKVIERQLLTKIIAEQKLTLTGIVDPASAKQLGKILGVDAIVAGSLTNLAQSVRVNARLISTQTGEVFATAAADIFKDESVTGLLAGGGGSTSAESSSKPASQATSSGKVPAQRVKDFIFEFTSCKMTGDAVTCFLIVKNDFTEDRQLVLYGNDQNPSRLIDEFGVEYLATGLRIGTYTNRYYQFVENTLITQVPTVLAVKFENVEARASRATLSLGIQISSSPYRVTFRNLPITK